MNSTTHISDSITLTLKKFLACICVWAGALPLLAQENTESNNQQAAEEDIVELSPFEVSVRDDRGYGTLATLGGTRMNIELINAAQSVSIINREIIDDLGAVNLASGAAVYASGISKRGRNSGNTNLTIRGSDAGQLAFIDGLPGGTAGESVSGLDPIGTERLEFVKGPAGALYGSHAGQGIQNRITKKPLGTQKTWLRFIGGSYDFLRGEIDTTGTLAEGKLGYRVAFAAQDAESKTGAPNDRRAFYSYLNYDISKNSKTWVRFEWTDFEAESATSSFLAAAPDPNNTLVGRTGLGIIPIDIAGGGRNFSLHDREAYSFELGYEHRFNIGDSSWTLKTAGRYGEMDFQLLEFIGSTFKFVDGSGNVIGTHSNTTWQSSGWVDVLADGPLNNTYRKETQEGIFADLAGDFKVGPSHHKLLIYGSYEKNEQPREERLRYNLTDVPFFDGFANVEAPGPFQTTGLAPELGTPVKNVDEILSDEIVGFGVQDNIRFLEERLIFVAGTGYRSGKGSAINRINNTSILNETNSDWVYKYGVVLKPVREGLAIFFNHGETFIPLSGFDDLGTPLRNRLLESNEFGFKLNLFDSRVIGTFTYFDTTEDGFLKRVLQETGPNAGQQLNIQAGVLTTEGWELDLALQPTDNFSFLIAASDFDHADENGDFIRAVPLDIKWSFITKYQFLEGAAKGLTVGLTYENTPERMGDSGNSFLIPGFEVWGAWTSYKFNEHWKIQLNVYNLANDEYVLGSANRSRIFFGDKRNFRFTLSYTF